MDIEQEKSEGNKSTPLNTHTLETLCKELVSGRAVLPDNGEEFRFCSTGTRSVFSWYLENRDKWSGRNYKSDVRAMAMHLYKKPLKYDVTKVAEAPQQGRRIHLKKLRAHRFGGIHKYGKVEEAPEDFEFDFGKKITVIEGKNGSGKTSLLNAITWCLTGHIHRSQRPPETAEQPVRLEIAEDVDEVSEEEDFYNMTPITPMPKAEILESLSDNVFPLDTWVELEFVDDEGTTVDKIRRSVQRTRGGKINIIEPDFSKLGIDPINREVGTKMPGLIPYIQVGKASDVGRAVATLTGFKPLEDLTGDAKKSQEKLKKNLVEDRDEEIESIDTQFSKLVEELGDLIQEHPNIDPRITIPEPSMERAIKWKLRTCVNKFEEYQRQAFEESRLILGESFNPADRVARLDLMQNVGPAMGLIGYSQIAKLKERSSAHGF